MINRSKYKNGQSFRGLLLFVILITFHFFPFKNEVIKSN